MYVYNMYAVCVYVYRFQFESLHQFQYELGKYYEALLRIPMVCFMISILF